MQYLRSNFREIYNLREDESSYLAATKDENDVPVGLHLEPVSEDMALHPEISFRSDGQIVFNQHEVKMFFSKLLKSKNKKKEINNI